MFFGRIYVRFFVVRPMPVQHIHAAGDGVVELASGAQVVERQHVVAHHAGPFTQSDLRSTAIVTPRLLAISLIEVKNLQHTRRRAWISAWVNDCVSVQSNRGILTFSAFPRGPFGHTLVIGSSSAARTGWNQPSGSWARASLLSTSRTKHIIDIGSCSPSSGRPFVTAKPAPARDVGVARAVDELPRTQGFRARLAATRCTR